MTEPDLPARTAILQATAGRLRIDLAIAGAMEGFAHAEVDARLLKGPAVARWLYVDVGQRSYLDCDVLIAPDDLARAEDVLQSLGYGRPFDDREMPSWWREHASEWIREQDGVTIDLHRTLPGIGADPATTWSVLGRAPAPVIVAQRSVPALSLPGRTLHVVLHAAQHGVGGSQALRDLERALEIAGEDLFAQAARLAESLDAADAFASGLRLSPAGRHLVDRLGLAALPSIDARLRATSAPPEALTIERLARTRGIAAKFEIVWRKLVPPAAFIRHWDPRASESRLALVRAYVRRPVWVLRHAPRGLAAWRRARRGGSQ